MKKFYAFAAAAMAALSMNAQLYVVGAGEGLDWNPGAPMVVEEADGAYTFDINNLTQFKVSTAMGDWVTFNEACLTCSYTKEDLGNAVALVSGEDNIGTPWKGDYHVVVVLGENPTITMTTTTPEPTGDPDLYIRGGMVDGWGAVDAWKFTSKGNGNYEFVCKDETVIPGGVEFKFADADWDKFNYGQDGVITTNTKEEQEDGDEVGSHWNYNAGNGTLAEDFTGTIYVTINLEDTKAGADVLFLKGYFENESVSSAIIENNGPKTYYNLQGVKVAQPTQGIYVVRQGDKVFKAVVK